MSRNAGKSNRGTRRQMLLFPAREAVSKEAAVRVGHVRGRDGHAVTLMDSATIQCTDRTSPCSAEYTIEAQIFGVHHESSAGKMKHSRAARKIHGEKK